MLRIYRREFLAAAGAAVLPSPALAAPSQFALVADGKSDFAITVRAGAPSSASLGARELQRFIEEASGARLPLVSEGQPASGPFKNLISVGATALPNEHYRIRARPGRIDIEGGGSRGALYGCLGFLEDVVGCRWFTTTVSRIPKRSTLVMNVGERFESPAFDYREPYYREGLDGTWAVRNRLNGAFLHLPEAVGGGTEYAGDLGGGAFVHTFDQLVPPAEHFGAHPEWYSERGGVRKAGTQLCLTNAEVRRALTSRARDWLRANRRATVISISQNDSYDICRCSRCSRVLARANDTTGSHLLLEFVNAVARDLAVDHPHVTIETLAYHWTEAPWDVAPEPNVRIMFAALGRCFSHGLDECEKNAIPRSRLDGWLAMRARVDVWGYGANFASFLRPLPDLEATARDLISYQRRGIRGVFVEGAYPVGGGGEMAALRSYLYAKLLWNPSLPLWPLVDEFAEAVYGEAGPFIASWLRALHAEVREVAIHATVFDGANPPYLTSALLRRGAREFDRAEAAVAGDVERITRVRAARLPLDVAILERAGACDSERARLLESVEDRIRSQGIRFFTEADSVDILLARLRAGAP